MLDEGHEIWAEWDEDVVGPQITAENEEDYPQGFIWCKDDIFLYSFLHSSAHSAIKIREICQRGSSE